MISFFESNHSMAGSILLTRNEVPFFKASLIAGAATVVLLLLFLQFTNMGVLAMVLAPGMAQLYNNWKWPYELIKQLSLSKKDVIESVNLIVIRK
jgi:hypothetical protein